jgi:lipoprotein-releasing system ATP-binding protein
MIEIKGISKNYGALKVLNNIDLIVNRSEVISIVGASGAGKTTLLQIIGTLMKPDQGQLFINNIEISKLNDKALSNFRNQHIGFVFQFHQLLPELNAIENVCLPAMIAGKSLNDSKPRAQELLGILNIENRANHKPNELSGGEQQRVAVARALMNNPSIILADEPSGNLDSHHATELHQLFFDLRDQFKQTFVIVTHNDALANMADRKIVMKDGQIVS